jgi:hypothetical protein
MKRPPRKAEEWVELGGWCRMHGLSARAREAYGQALAGDEDLEAARHGLGWLQHAGEWVQVGELVQAAAESGVKSLRELAGALQAAGLDAAEELAPLSNSGNASCSHLHFAL